MIRKSLTTLFLGAMLVLSGCASVPMADKQVDAQAKLFTPNAEQATVYIYRNQSLSTAIKMPVLIDGVPVGDTVAKSYILKTLAPGNHVIVSKADNYSSLAIDMRAGQTYYVWQEVKKGFALAHSELHEVDEAKWRAGVRHCALVKSP